MPVPVEYQRGTDQFYEFLEDARDVSGLGSTHQAFTMTQGVLQTFRRRLELQEAIQFAGILPAGLRALFVADWNPNEPKRPFESRPVMTKEVQSLRGDHNFAPESAIRDVAEVLRRHVDQIALDRVLAQMSAGAVEFWKVG